MKIASVSSRAEAFALTRPYTIAFGNTAAVENVILSIETTSGLTGLGAAAPQPRVTGETPEACRAGLAEEALSWLIGRDIREAARLCREARERLAGPAARAAVDMALHDLLAQHLGVPLVELLGRAHEALETSITIGIKPLEETLSEAEEYVARGFTMLKVKVGLALAADLERLARLRETVGRGTKIRVDANQGYSTEEVSRFFRETASLDLEFLEQPLPAGDAEALRSFPAEIRDRIAADESLLDEKDALSLATPPRACGIFNIKLMKCGGIQAALRIAAIAEATEIQLMWGCMDESVISIAAALHTALASPATRYLDLDGSFDLARDVAEGGFLLENGWMRTTAAPGLGVRLA